MSGEEDDVTDGIDPAVEQEARGMGWLPEEEFKGNKDKWVSAEEYVERGKHIMPILLANNKRLTGQLGETTTKLSKVEQALANTNAALEKIEKHHAEAVKRAVDEAKSELRQQIKEARENGDFDAEEAARDKLDELKKSTESSQAPEPKASVKKDDKPEDNLTDDFRAWHKENKWFGDNSSPENKKKTKEVTRLAEDIREEGSKLEGKAFMDFVVEEYEKRNAPDKRSSKVEGHSGRGAPNGNGGKSFADLPKDAQQACLADQDIFVGEGKRHKTLDSWKKAYTNIYFGQE